MKRNVLHLITIKFKKALNGNRFSSPLAVEYYQGHGATDSFRFLQTKVEIKAYRQTIHSKESILSLSYDNINSQILKAILAFYANCKNFPEIKSISVHIEKPIVKKDPIIKDYKYTAIEIRQIVDSRIPRETDMYFVPAKELMQESVLGRTMRTALSYWIEALNSATEYNRFDRLWTAFNAIFAYYDIADADSRDIDKLAYLRSKIKVNAVLFPNTINKVSVYTTATLRTFRWMLLCKNEIKRNKNKADQLCQFMTRFDDERVLNLFAELISSSKIKDKIDKSPYATTMRKKVLALGRKEDIDVVILLCIKYAYFLRNQKVHGHVWDPNFSIGNTALDKELPIINHLLASLLLEIMKDTNAIPIKTV